MTVHENEEIVRRYLLVGWGQNQPDVLEEILSPNCIRHLEGAVSEGHEAAETLAAFQSAFPKFSVEIELLFGKDDMVVCRSKTRGTHLGALGSLPATGRSVVIIGVDFFRLAGGKIVESWHNVDETGMMRQLRVGPLSA